MFKRIEDDGIVIKRQEDSPDGEERRKQWPEGVGRRIADKGGMTRDKIGQKESRED